MRHIAPYSLWIGHVNDARNLRAVLEAGIEALVDLALNELPPNVTRELVYCRFPILDGTGNAPWLLRLATFTTAELICSGTPTFLFCGAGMNRSPAIAAAALARVTARRPEDCLAEVIGEGPGDVSPGLWHELLSATF
jgi:hypothetical protein